MKDALSSLNKLLQETRNLVAFHNQCELNYPLSPEMKAFLQPRVSQGKGKRQPVAPTPGPSAPVTVKTSVPAETVHLSLENLRQTLADCSLCPLAKSRQRVIFGEGSVRQGLALLLISDPPGVEDGAADRPVSGASRELLKKMLGAINLSLDDIFLTNIVKCVPPAERTPTAEETSACLPLLIHQIELIKPKIICTMGQIASQTMLKTSQSLFGLRGRFHDFQGIPLMPTFHPARLLKVQELKKGAWHDLQMIEKKLKSLG